MSTTNRTVVAAIWTMGATFLSKIIDFLTLVVLARVLIPEDFGLIALAMAVVVVVESILEIPITQGIVKADFVDDDLIDTAFTLSLIRGTLLALMMVILAVPMAKYFDEPRLTQLIVALSVAPIARGLLNPRLALYIRKLDMRFEALLSFIGKVVTLVVALTIALLTDSYWAIAMGTIFGPVSTTILSYFLRTHHVKLSLSSWNQFSDMIGWNTIAQIISVSNWQLSRILTGKYLNTTWLGFLTMSQTIVAVPVQAILQPMGRPFMAAFSSTRRSNPIELKEAYLRCVHALFLVSGPVLLFIALLAESLVIIVLGQEWLAVVPLIQLEAASVLLTVSASVLKPLAMSMDKTKLVACRNGIEFSLMLPFTIFALFNYGLVAAVGARLFISFVMLPVNMIFVKKIGGPLVRMQIKEQLISICIVSCQAPFMFFISVMAKSSKSTFEVLTIISCGVVLAIFIHLVVTVLVWWLRGMPQGIESFMFDATRKMVGRSL